MSSTNTWYINLKSADMTNIGNSTFQTVINIPDTAKYSKFKLTVKDFIVVRASFSGSDTVYQLCSNLHFSNSFDSRNNSVGNSPVLAVLPYSISHFTSKGNNTLDLTSSLNGNILQFWIEDYTNTRVVQQNNFQPQAITNNYVSFVICFILQGVDN